MPSGGTAKPAGCSWLGFNPDRTYGNERRADLDPSFRDFYED